MYLELIPDNKRLLQRAECLAEGAKWQAKALKEDSSGAAGRKKASKLTQRETGTVT